jgi:glutamate decarboxylase
MGSLRKNWYHSLPSEALHAEFLQDVTKLLLKEAVFAGTQRKNPVVSWHDPEHLYDLLNLTPTDKPTTHTELLQVIHDTISFSVKTGHPYFINQLFSRSV